MAPRARERVHESSLADEIDVVVATSTLGMGIDKPEPAAALGLSGSYCVTGRKTFLCNAFSQFTGS